jgi:signal transduction histidine kinase
MVPIGLAAIVVAFALVRPLRALSRRLVSSMLGSGGTSVPPDRARGRHLRVHAGVAGGIAGVLIVIWAATSRGAFWPGWAIAPLAVPLAIHGWAVYVETHGRGWGRWRGPALHAGISAAIELYLVVVWALAGGGYFWPVWPFLALAVTVAVHAAVVSLRRPRGERALTARIEQLETRRAGAVDVQDAELRRIERDLHDGAQARLVALGMSLGMAEQKLVSDPDAARELLGEARRGATEALRELRDLARGIHPPVLTDRGLGAAIAALADRSAVPVHIEDGLAERPPAPVESAAYFVVAEALANAGKHADARAIGVRLRRCDDTLEIEVEDDGGAGPIPTGAGSPVCAGAWRRTTER